MDRAEVDVRPLETHANWTAADVADPDVWTHRLTADEIAELEAAVAVARARTDEVLDVRKDEFPLPTLGPILRTIAEELIDGRGFQRISALPVERVGVDDASWMYWGIGLHLGVPWPQNVKGHLLGDVKDQGKRPDDPTARGNELGGVAQTFHSDGSDLVGLMCLDPGVSGGESLVANAVGAYNRLVGADPALAAVLFDGLPYDFRGEQRDGGTPFYTVPVFSQHDDRLFVRYIRPYIEASQRHADAPRLSADQRAAMDAYDALIHDADHRVEMTFAPGDMQFVNNYHVLHGRRSYVDDPESGRVRWLKRLWLATDILGPNDRPERFQAAGATSHWAANRTRA
ncbi:MAG: TauD/TfdA family dioxygenase [Acidimicrobiales bacterium]